MAAALVIVQRVNFAKKDLLLAASTGIIEVIEMLLACATPSNLHAVWTDWCYLKWAPSMANSLSRLSRACRWRRRRRWRWRWWRRWWWWWWPSATPADLYHARGLSRASCSSATATLPTSTTPSTAASATPAPTFWFTAARHVPCMVGQPAQNCVDMPTAVFTAAAAVILQRYKRWLCHSGEFYLTSLAASIWTFEVGAVKSGLPQIGPFLIGVVRVGVALHDRSIVGNWSH